MISMANNKTKILLNVGVVAVIILFAFSLFKNISYPLLWNDEASTAMFGKTVSEYGYPKAHDGKNSLYLFSDTNHNLGIRSNGDVYVAEGWMQYYVASIGDHLANQYSDIYAKTAALRIPFAIAGFLGIIIFGLTISLFFINNRKKAFILFFIFELISISLVLHLREVRYYSLVVLFSSVLFYFYLRYAVLKNLSYKHYVWTIVLFITLLFHTHYPVAAAFLITLGLHSLFLSVSRCQKKLSVFINTFFKSILPLFISILFIIPSLVYFKTFEITQGIATEYSLGIGSYLNNIFQGLSFFANFEFLYLVIFLKILFVLLFIYEKNISRQYKTFVHVSNFLSLFFCVYILVIARTLHVFERYVIVLQPVLVCIILLDIFICWQILKQIFANEHNNKKMVLGVFILIIFFSASYNYGYKTESIKGHLYELTHRYMGALDFVIPYIKENYHDTANLIIATGYEENSLMYYLNSRVIVGYVGNNLDEDRKLQPDIIVYRKSYPAFIDIFNSFLKTAKYKMVSFPIFDYPVNNIPELNYSYFTHLYKTKPADNDWEKLDIYLKQ